MFYSRALHHIKFIILPLNWSNILFPAVKCEQRLCFRFAYIYVMCSKGGKENMQAVMYIPNTSCNNSLLYKVCSVLCALVCFEGRGGFCFFRAAALYFTRRQVQCALAALGSCDFDTGILFLCVFCHLIFEPLKGFLYVLFQTTTAFQAHHIAT